MPTARLIKHNPVFLSDEELERAFVVRQAELGILADLVRGNQGEVNQHALVIGPRGMGKTLLMRSLALLVRTDEELKDSWHPIVAPEELYDAGTEGEVWLAILKSLADQERREGRDFERWNARYEALVAEPDEERLRTLTLGALTEYSREQGKRLLILIENLQMILGEQFAKDADWDLRKTLLGRSEIMLVFTATTRFDEIRRPSFAAYELFRELQLEPLGTDDCRRLWQAISGENLVDQRIRPMEILTGGNPRLLAILATFAPERPLRELMENLAELIDEHTPFLKSNIDALAPQERRVFVNLAKLWEPSTARQVGARCRLASNTASAVLKSLVNRGVVVERGKQGRAKLYQVAERIYCIYYSMRLSGSEAERMRAFVRFMVPLYGEHNLARSLAEAACNAVGQERTGFIEGYRELVSQGLSDGVREQIIMATPATFLDLPEVKSFVPVHDQSDEGEYRGGTSGGVEIASPSRELAGRRRQALELMSSGRPVEAVEVLDQILASEHGQESAALALITKGAILRTFGRDEEALEVFSLVESRFSESEIPEVVEHATIALLNKGLALCALGRREEAVEVYDEVVSRFSESEAPRVIRLVGTALNGKAWLHYSCAVGSLADAIEVAETAVALRPFRAEVKHTLASVLGLAGRWDEAFSHCEGLLDDEEFTREHLDDVLALMIDAAADGEAERALAAITGMAAERAMEPLVAALKELTGVSYRAPQEVEECWPGFSIGARLSPSNEREVELHEVGGRCRADEGRGLAPHVT